MHTIQTRQGAPDLISLPEAAMRAGASVATISRWCRAGAVRRYKCGRQTLVSRADVQALVEPKEVTG